VCSGNSWLAPTYDVYSPASATGTATVANYYGSNSSALTQCISVGNILQVTTSDGFNQVVNWADPIAGNATSVGAMLNNGNLLFTCRSGSYNTNHLAVRSDSGATVFKGTAARLMLGTAFAFSSLECGPGGTSALRGVTTVAVAADLASATVTDTTSSPASVTTFSAAQLDALFSPSGLVLGSGKTLRWVLYLVPVSSGLIKQVIVHTAVQTDGSVNVFSFVQP
jgi:PKD repeat protein